MKRLISILFPAILVIAMACAAGNSTAATTLGKGNVTAVLSIQTSD
jgi:hypothetical protein